MRYFALQTDLVLIISDRRIEPTRRGSEKKSSWKGRNGKEAERKRGLCLPQKFSGGQRGWWFWQNECLRCLAHSPLTDWVNLNGFSRNKGQEREKNNSEKDRAVLKKGGKTVWNTARANGAALTVSPFAFSFLQKTRSGGGEAKGRRKESKRSRESRRLYERIRRGKSPICKRCGQEAGGLPAKLHKSFLNSLSELSQ